MLGLLLSRGGILYGGCSMTGLDQIFCSWDWRVVPWPSRPGPHQATILHKGH